MSRNMIAIVAALAWSASMFGAGWAWRGDRAEIADAKRQAASANASAAQITEVRTIELGQAAVMAEIGAKHEEDRQAATAVPDAVVADLRAGNLRLRNEWAGCETKRLSDAAASAAERDALAASRDDLAGAIVQVGRDSDDQLRACQEVVRADREH